MDPFKISKFTIELPIRHPDKTVWALFNTLTKGFVLAFEPLKKICLTDPPTNPDLHDDLVRQGFIVKTEVDETAVFESWYQQHCHGFNFIKSKVLVTRRCNMSCLYCILDPEAGVMTRQTAQSMDHFYLDLISRKNPEMVRDDYLGGEALLFPEIIYESTQRRYYFCKGKNVDYGFSLTTNGTLLDRAWIARFKKIGLTEVRISMAGPADIHNRLRPMANGHPTYQMILDNAAEIADLTGIIIEYQYDAGNEDYLRVGEMLDDFAARDIRPNGIASTPILSSRNNNQFNAGLGHPGQFLFLKKELQNRGFAMYEQPPASACLSDLRSAFVFDTDGSLLPCPSVKSGEMAYGHVKTGVDFAGEANLLKRHLDTRCLNECELLPLCLGGCRLQSLIKDHDFNSPHCHYEYQKKILDDHIHVNAQSVIDKLN